MPVADSDNGVLDPVEDGPRNVEDVVPASLQPQQKPRVNKGKVFEMVLFECGHGCFWL